LGFGGDFGVSAKIFGGKVHSSSELRVFTARRVCIARTMPWQNVCPSVCHTPLLCLNGYAHMLKIIIFTAQPQSSDVSLTPGFFCKQYERTFRQLRNGQFLTNFATTCEWWLKGRFRTKSYESFHSGIICPQNLKLTA